MKIKLTTPILEYNGDKIFVNEEKTEVYDIRRAITTSLNTNDPSKPDLPENKNKIYSICTRLYKGNDVDLTIDDLAFIKEKAEYALLPLFLGRLLEVIDPK